MSRSVVRYRALLVLALVALAVGTTTSAAFGWANEEGSGSEQEQSHQGGKKEHGNEEHGNKENKGENHNKGNHGENQKPEEETPATPQPQPQPTPVPPVATPVAPQGTPAQTPEQQPSTPPATEETPKSTEVAQSPTVGQPSVSATPAANREQLASTGIDPALIALFGALFVGGGALLFRRSLAGDRE